jgi:ABC-type nitrate/sulfonate/bicarbonate transport system substrate-binding protein
VTQTQPYSLELIAFPGAPNLPIFVAQEKGYFENAGVRVNLTTTPSSGYQAENLINGKFHIAGTAFDNVVAYQEGAGAVTLSREPDLFAFMGATQIELAFIVAPEIASYEDLKGKSLAMDALSTGFAFVLYEMLERNGLTPDDYQMAAVGATPLRWEAVRSGKHVGTLTIEPFTSIAKSQGFRVLDSSANMFGCYQGGAFVASRQWATANPAALKSYIKGYLESLAWTLAPENRAAATDVLLRNMPEIKPQVADAVMHSLLSPKSGLTPEARILMPGVTQVLELRARHGGGAPLDPSRYIDLSYYDAVVRG